MPYKYDLFGNAAQAVINNAHVSRSKFQPWGQSFEKVIKKL